MDKVYERVTNGHADNGTTEILSQSAGLAEINGCRMGDLGRQVLRMSSLSRTDYHIVYRNGDVVTLKLVDAPKTEAAKTEQGPKVWTGEDTVIVTVKGKRYVAGLQLRGSGVRHLFYWSERNGQSFGATRDAHAGATRGSVAHGVWHAVMDHLNGTGA